MSGKKKKKVELKYVDVQLNIMPFLDVFSLLTTFLLMTAVFTSIGVIEVQIPFLTSAPPDKKETERSLDLKVDMEKDKVEVIASWSQPPTNERKQTFQLKDKTWDRDMHNFLVDIKKSSPDTDKVQLFTEDDVIWKDITKALDAIKLRVKTDPQFPIKAGANAGEVAMAREFLFPKVTMASVMLP